MRKPLMIAGIMLLCFGIAFGAETARKGGKSVVILETSLGVIKVELYPDKAPVSVQNFLAYVKEGHYDGLIFHRVIAGFMIQGGDPQGDGRGGPGYTFTDEFDPTLRFDRAGLLAMANRGANTNGSQFFVTLAATEWLNNKHTIFGEVVEGMEIITRIGSVRTGPGDRPVAPVVLKTVTIQRVKE